MSDYPIEMKDIVMEFSGVRALDGVDFSLKKGEIKGLVGKNGAGKSTLMKIINGVYTQTSGTIKFFGKEITKNTSVKEREKSVSMIYQDYSLVGEMTVTQNIFLNAEPQKGLFIDDKNCIEKVRSFFKSLDLNIDPMEKVKKLSTGDMQLVEIAKAIIKNTNVILMDEPTAALDAEATIKFFNIIGKLKAQGCSIVISTHHLKQIMEICDSVTVIRDGKIAMNEQISDVTLQGVIASMLGESNFEARNKRKIKHIDTKVPLLRIDKIVSKHSPNPISFNVYPGEVVGLAGLKGSGRTEIFNSIFGVDPVTSGKLYLEEKEIRIKSPETAIKKGIFLIPENRHTQGLSLMHSLYDNALLPIISRLTGKNLLINDKLGTEIVDDLIDEMKVKTSGRKEIMSKLSGGNQQKVVVGKALKSKPKIMLMDDPTYGVDIHAKGEIANAIERFTSQGYGVIFVSSELSEMIENCDRILIVKSNEIKGEIKDIPTANLTEDSLMAEIQ